MLPAAVLLSQAVQKLVGQTDPTRGTEAIPVTAPLLYTTVCLAPIFEFIKECCMLHQSDGKLFTVINITIRSEWPFTSITNTITVLLLPFRLPFFFSVCCWEPFEFCVLVVGWEPFEFCVFVVGWKHAIQSEWPFSIIIMPYQYGI